MPDFEDLGEFLTPTQEPERSGLVDGEALPLTTASALTDEISEPAELGFGPDGRYKGFQIIPSGQLPPGLPAVHAGLSERFYVASPRGNVGLVPWAGSVVVWPWERGWLQDLSRSNVQSLLRPEKAKK